MLARLMKTGAFHSSGFSRNTTSGIFIRSIRAGGSCNCSWSVRKRTWTSLRPCAADFLAPWGEPVQWDRLESTELEKSVWLNRWYYLPSFARQYWLSEDRSLLDDLLKLFRHWVGPILFRLFAEVFSE